MKFMINSKDIKMQKFCRYISIIFLTLYQMMSVGVNENDLHMGNILITNKSFGPTNYHSRVYLLVFDKTTYIIDNHYTPIVYDFDRASIKNKYMSRLKTYTEGGNCPQFHKKRDFIRLLCGIVNNIPLLETKDEKGFRSLKKIILQTLIKSDTLKQAVLKSDKSCWMTKGNTSTQCDDKLLNSGMVEPKEIVKKFFDLAKFKTIPTKKLIEGKDNFMNTVAQYLYTRNNWKITEDSKKYKFITANVQFVGTFNYDIKNTIIEKLAIKL